MAIPVRRGDVLMVNLEPEKGSEQGGTKPVVAIQNNIGNEYSPVIIVAAITSKVKKLFDIHVKVLSPEGGLTCESIVLLNQIRTIDKNRIIRKTGSLSTDTMEKIDAALRISLDM